MNTKKIAILGCGNLGTSILKGLLSNSVSPENIICTRRNVESLQEFRDQGVNVTSDNAQAAEFADLIILAVKPFTLEAVVREVGPNLRSNHLLISAVSGTSIQEINQQFVGDCPIFRVMPNTASDVGQSVTLIATVPGYEDQVGEVSELFDSIGEAIVINEELMDAATVLGACGIAFVMRFMRAMTQGGIQIGFDAKTAGRIVNQVVKGAAELLIERGNHPEQEIDKVTTPKGCTIVGLNEMEHNGFSSSLIKGIVKSHDQIAS
jgi:pyrroline-5-carboxylate reductase